MHKFSLFGFKKEIKYAIANFIRIFSRSVNNFGAMHLAAGLGAAQLSHEEVFEIGRQVEQRLARLLERLVPRIAALREQEQ